MQNQAKTIKEFKDFLLNLIDRRKKGEELDFNKEICKKFNLELTRFDDVTMVYNDSIHCYDNEGVIDSKWSIFLDLFDYDNIESSNEKNIDVNKLLVKYNIVSSCFYYLIVIENKLYRVKGYSFLNDNLVGDNYIDFNSINTEEYLLNNFPKGRIISFNKNYGVLDCILELNINKENNESKNYFAKDCLGILRKGKYVYIHELKARICSDVYILEDYVILKDYESNLFKVNKISGSKIDFDTISKLQGCDLLSEDRVYKMELPNIYDVLECPF